MRKPYRYLETGSTDPYYNLAFEEYVLEHCHDGDYLILWQNDNTVVIGLNQVAAQEVDEEFLKAHEIRLVRRMTGGGAVYHDLGNLNYSFITDAERAEGLSFEAFARPVVDALCRLDLPAALSGRNDIEIAGKKVSGCAQRICKGRVLHHGTLLFSSDAGMISGALRADPEKFTSKATKSVRSRVANIRSFLKEDMTIEAFWQYLRKSLVQEGIVQTTLEPYALEAIQKLRNEKYATREWNYGRAPRYGLHAARRFAGGSIEVQAQVKGGVIEEIDFLGDFLARRELTPVRDALRGVPMEEAAVANVLETLPLQDYFGTILAEELLELLFHTNSHQT